MTDKTRENLLIGLKYIRYAIEEASKNGKPGLAIVSVKEDGGGKVECKFDTDFIRDVALLLNAPDLTDDDRRMCSVQKFLDVHQIKAGND